jgi:hypothetical protein
MNKNIIYIVIALVLTVAGFYAGQQYKPSNPLAAKAERKAFSIKDIPEDEICYRGTGVWNGISPRVRYPDMYQGLERIAVYVHYGNVTNRAMACMENEDKCKSELLDTYKRISDVDHYYKIYKDAFNSYPEKLRAGGLFSVAKSVLEPTLGQCGDKKKPITLHYEPTDDIFYQKGTLGVYVTLQYNKRKQYYSMRIHKYRPDMNDFKYLQQSVQLYREMNIKELSSKELTSQIRSHFYRALIK